MASSRKAGRERAQLVRAYRITAPRWLDSAFSGEGARRHGGRWNSRGIPVVYLAGSRALAALESLVHLTTPESRAKPFFIVEASFPAALLESARESRPSREEGDRWFASASSLALEVPSVLIPEEPNFLINPQHPSFSKIRIGEPQPFSFDPRL